MMFNRVWKLYLVNNKSITEISEQLNITKSKLKIKYGIK